MILASLMSFYFSVGQPFSADSFLLANEKKAGEEFGESWTPLPCRKNPIGSIVTSYSSWLKPMADCPRLVPAETYAISRLTPELKKKLGYDSAYRRL